MWLGLSIEFWLATVITIIVSAAGVLVTIRKRPSGQIAVGFTLVFELVSQIAHEFSNLRITYKGDDIHSKITLVSGRIINTGDIDVGRSIVTHYPSIRLKNGAEWKEFELGKTNEGIDPEVEAVSESEVRVRWGLLKPGESIPFSSLIKTPENADNTSFYRGSLTEISARIENVAVKFERDIVDTPEKVRRRISDSVGVVVTISVLFIFGAVYVGSNILTGVTPAVITYELLDHPDETYTLASVSSTEASFQRYPKT